ncbi:MAG: TIGR00725 family protein [Candidatus Eremiobacter antarcticus]|nr:TIGR00725 family protein [Candidatus Eremiobacteraeota bacterium]MBC5808837.1 TIGR00725 family protein [Candidatus Eremiobacteraeota bacterium]PZR60475.1 MAG: TIGR00725 family protein [Candidatus Eremiobacter sp. RRmetagenome_bin22]
MKGRPPRIGVVGGRDAEASLLAAAEDIGRELAERGAIVVCGGMGGIMEAAARGCVRAGGIVVGILPTESAADANAHVTIPVVTGMNEGRNIIVVRTSEALIAIGGSYGTLSEIALALRLNVPVFGLNTWGLRQPGSAAAEPALTCVESAQEAVERAWQVVQANRLPERRAKRQQ